MKVRFHSSNAGFNAVSTLKSSIEGYRILKIYDRCELISRHTRHACTAGMWQTHVTDYIRDQHTHFAYVAACVISMLTMYMSFIILCTLLLYVILTCTCGMYILYILHAHDTCTTAMRTNMLSSHA